MSSMAVVSAAVPATTAQEVAQIGDFFKDQEKLRRKNQRVRRGKATATAENKRKSAARRTKKRKPHLKKPPKQTTTDSHKSDAATAAKKQPADETKKDSVAEREPSPPPAYIRAKQEPIVKMLGADIAKKIFSHEFTPVRQLAIARSARVIPGFECPRDPAVALTDVVPFKVKSGVTSWIESYVVGCKPRAKRSFLVMLEDDKPQFAELLPGLSIADPLLQRDAIAGAQASANAVRPEGCEKSIIADTRLAEPLSGAGRSWVEMWTFDQCGTARRVEMRFTPSKQGGTRWAAKLLK